MRAPQRLVLAALVAVGGACHQGEQAAHGEEEGSGAAAPRHGAFADYVPLNAADSAWIAERAGLEPGALALVPAVPVVGWTGPGGLPFEVTVRTASPSSATARAFGQMTLTTSLRTRSPDIGQYPCSACHAGRALRPRAERIGDAHANIVASHPQHTGGACTTCHDAANVERLALRSGAGASLDHTYRVCAQCHFAEATAWAGGGHGKRLDGWQGRRVVLGCADCHDPHTPALTTRVPFRGPRLSRPSGGSDAH